MERNLQTETEPRLDHLRKKQDGNCQYEGNPEFRLELFHMSTVVMVTMFLMSGILQFTYAPILIFILVLEHGIDAGYDIEPRRGCCR